MRERHPYLGESGSIVALAHRGFSREGLENSMKAFQAAVDLGFRYVETDAHGTADGVAVALHDASLDRTTDRVGLVSSLPSSEVLGARIGGVEPVPLLEDVLGTWPELRVNIDVKAVSGIGPVADAIERTGSHARVCVASFSARRRVATLKRLSRPVATSAGTSEAAGFFAVGALGRGVGAALRRVDLLQIPAQMGRTTLLTSRHVTAAHRVGREVHVWTVNETAEMTRLLEMGVDGLVSDRADLLRDVLIARGSWS
ncbi:glycerophosphodiester phosphodiesterase family protein [Demequina capsici]|uniref:Glycerophosphodiester phosphodiesterase family protein n=1 Tax=Demequina capsici TaxID=3075620 RepID=A0AA96FG19_9MICO|nr:MULTISPECIES: glycerophosphodiester phosphodiesterase family protein [unclassified Demequina]WNM25906.1 glycerophosphodiester phosphodiesterase family protein [Demequina sp. OYTSA14]WNM28807.1 glycerophosphodiester phosphodiesterase family protein [Demequina sp. PMTSA13]